MRSPGEIWFRLRQESANAAAVLITPDLPSGIREVERPALLPDPESFIAQLRGSSFAEHIGGVAEMIRSHRFPLLGGVVETGREIRWRRDHTRGIESGLGYFRLIPYLDAARTGDHKLIWELNRHQHLIVLAQAFRLTGRRDFLDEIGEQLESWWAQNPWLRGINWASALEVAFRAFSWIWVDHLAGAALDTALRRRLLRELYRHGVYLERNLSIYFAPNTHLLGEATALHALAAIYPEWPRSGRWRELGARLVREQMNTQVRDDGSHFEQSSYYHVYALDLFLLHALLEAGVSDEFRQRMRSMADYLGALSSDDGSIPFLGDDDGGNVFHPYGDRRRFGAATLAACRIYFDTDEWPCTPTDIGVQAAWWIGRRALDAAYRHSAPAGDPQLFAGAGVAVFSRTPVHIVADSRGFGHAGAGHSHAHALSVVCRKADRDILIDPGTFTYTADPVWRSRFRGTAFHNTVRIDGLDQARDGGPFRWLDKPETRILGWTTQRDFTHLSAVCGYRGFEHLRQIVWIPEDGLLAIVDTVRGKAEDAAPHRVEQFWHCGGDIARDAPCLWRINDAATLTVPASSDERGFSGGEYGWRSDVPGQKTPAPLILVERVTALPVTLGAVLAVGSCPVSQLGLEVSGDRVRLLLDNRRSIIFSAGLPVIEMFA